MLLFKNNMATKKINFDIESREGEEDRTTISIKGIGEVVLIETFPEYEFLEDIGEDGLEELNVEEGDLIGKIEHLEINDEYKGQGYAKLLMNKAIEVAKEKGLMPLYLNASPMGSKRYGLDVDDLTGFYESLGFEVFLRQGGNNLMILKDTYKTGGETKNKIMAKQIKIQFADDNYANGGVTYSEWSKDDFWQEQFNDWMEDGNVTKNADGTYSTQDAQYRNRLKNMSELKRYFYNEFIKGQYDSYAGGGGVKSTKKYVVKGNVYDGGEIWKETFDNLDEAISLATEIENGWTDDGTYYLVTIYNETGKKVAEISTDKYFHRLTDNKLFKKIDFDSDTKKERQAENEKLKGYKFNLQVRIASYPDNLTIYDKTFDSIFDVMDEMNTYYEENYYAYINNETLDYWQDKMYEIDQERNYIKGKYGWYFIKEGNLWIAKDDYEDNHIVRIVNGKLESNDSAVTKGALKQIAELESQKKYSEKPKHNKSLADMKKIWDKLSKNYKEREDIAFLIGYYGGTLEEIVPYKWDDIEKGTQIRIMNAYFGQTEEQKQKIIDERRKRHESLVKEHKTLRNLYGLDKKGKELFGVKKFAGGGSLDDINLVAKAIEYITGSAIDRDSIKFEGTMITFRYKGQNRMTDISQKLIQDTISMHRKSLEGRYAEGGSVGKGYSVFNYTDNIYATDEVFKTKKLANDFIKEFRNRFSKQGYYRDNRMNKIAVEDIDLLAIPSDFNPFGKYEDGGEMQEEKFRYKDFYQSQGGIKFKTEEEAERFIKTTKPFVRKQLREGNFVLVFNGKEYFIGEKIKINDEYAEGGSVGKGYSVFNYTDNIYATDEVFKTKKLANDFIKEFRNRYSKQGYYRDNRMNKIAIEDIDLLAIPSDFNPFGNYADGGEVMVNGLTKQDYIDAYLKRVDSVIENLTQKGEYDSEDFDLLGEVDKEGGFTEIEDVGFWLDWANTKGDYDALTEFISVYDFSDLDNYTFNTLAHLYFAKPMKIDLGINSGGDSEYDYNTELQKIKLLLNKIDFDRITGEINYEEMENNTNLKFYKNGTLVMSLNGDWNEETEELDAIIDIDGETTELNYHPLDSMGGVSMEQLEKNINEAFRELNTYSAVVSIEGYEEYAEDVEGLENAKNVIQDIKGNTRFQVLKGSSVGIGKRVDDSRVVAEYKKGGETGFDNEGTSMVLYHEKNGNWLVPKGQVYLYLYDVEDSGSKLGKEFDWVFYPLTAPIMAFQSGYIPPLKKIWTKKFQKDHKGSEHLLGVIKAYLIEEDGKKELFIDMMSVNPTKKKKGIMSYMIKELRDTFNLSQDQITFSDLTPEGEKFVAKKTYADGGEITIRHEIKNGKKNYFLYDVKTGKKSGSYKSQTEANDKLKNLLQMKYALKLSSRKYADGGETSGLITDEQVNDLSFKIKIKNVPLKKGVLLHEIVTLEEFDLPDEENINFYPFHLIYGDSSLAIFDAFGVDEVAGLKRADAEKKINELKAQGKTEKDGSFIAGLTNYVGDKLFMFFNVARLSYEGFANRVLPHEALHLSRSLISLLKNDWVRENLNTPKWWEDKRAVFVDMGDSNEEFFAETLERTTAIAMDGWYRVTGQKCIVDKDKTYANGGGVDYEPITKPKEPVTKPKEKTGKPDKDNPYKPKGIPKPKASRI